MANPILHLDIPLMPEGGRGVGCEWHESVDYLVWRACLPKGAPGLRVWEKFDNGVAIVPERDALMHQIPAGRPYHMEHLFGYWRNCGGDTIFFRTVQGDDVYYALVLGGTHGAYQSDGVMWICPKCATELGHHRVDGGKTRWRAFLARQLELVRAFNEDESLRTCQNCGFVHPTAYGFDPSQDSAPEAEARGAW